MRHEPEVLRGTQTQYVMLIIIHSCSNTRFQEQGTSRLSTCLICALYKFFQVPFTFILFLFCAFNTNVFCNKLKWVMSHVHMYDHELLGGRTYLLRDHSAVHMLMTHDGWMADKTCTKVFLK